MPNTIQFRNNTVLPRIRESKKKGALTAEAQRALLEEAKTSQYYPLYRLSSLSGMRIGEILGLQWDDIDFEKGEIHITHTLSYIPKRGLYLDIPKSAASCRTIPFENNGEICNLLKERRRKQQMQKNAGWRILDTIRRYGASGFYCQEWETAL